MYQKAIDHLKQELGKLKTGRANPSLLDSVMVDAYGAVTPLNQVATITAPDATMIMVSPWDKSLINDIVKGIQKAEIGINPIVDSIVIRLPVPPLTEETRKELVKKAKLVSEEAKVTIRNIRKDEMNALDVSAKAEKMPEDSKKRAEELIQKTVDKFITEVDSIVKEKSDQLMAI